MAVELNGFAFKELEAEVLAHAAGDVRPVDVGIPGAVYPFETRPYDFVLYAPGGEVRVRRRRE